MQGGEKLRGKQSSSPDLSSRSDDDDIDVETGVIRSPGRTNRALEPRSGSRISSSAPLVESGPSSDMRRRTHDGDEASTPLIDRQEDAEPGGGSISSSSSGRQRGASAHHDDAKRRDESGGGRPPRLGSTLPASPPSMTSSSSSSLKSLSSAQHGSGGGVMPHQMTMLGLVFLDLFGVGLAMPLVVPLIKDLGATPVELGFLSSTYGAVQLLSGPYMGLVSDLRGRRLVILVSYIGTGLGYFLLGQSTSIAMVVVSRVITGLLKHSINATKAYISDHTSGVNRAIELGRMATASGLGIMVGPTIGGLLFKVGGYPLPATLATLLYVVSSAIVVTQLPPNELPPAATRKAPSPSAPGGGSGLLTWQSHLIPDVSMLARPRVLALFAVRAVLGLAVQVFRQGFSALLIYKFHLSVQSNGLLLSYQGALTSLVQGFAIKPLVQRYQDEPLILRGLLLLAASFAACSMSPSVLLLAITLTPVALATGVLRTTYTALLTSSVSPSEVGQLLGLSDAVMSGCRVMGPTLAGVVAQSFGHTAPGALSGVLTLAATVLFYFSICKNQGSVLRSWSGGSIDDSSVKSDGWKRRTGVRSESELDGHSKDSESGGAADEKVPLVGGERESEAASKKNALAKSSPAPKAVRGDAAAVLKGGVVEAALHRKSPRAYEAVLM